MALIHVMYCKCMHVYMSHVFVMKQAIMFSSQTNTFSTPFLIKLLFACSGLNQTKLHKIIISTMTIIIKKI